MEEIKTVYPCLLKYEIKEIENAMKSGKRVECDKKLWTFDRWQIKNPVKGQRDMTIDTIPLTDLKFPNLIEKLSAEKSEKRKQLEKLEELLLRRY